MLTVMKGKELDSSDLPQNSSKIQCIKCKQFITGEKVNFCPFCGAEQFNPNLDNTDVLSPRASDMTTHIEIPKTMAVDWNKSGMFTDKKHYPELNSLTKKFDKGGDNLTDYDHDGKNIN